MVSGSSPPWWAPWTSSVAIKRREGTAEAADVADCSVVIFLVDFAVAIVVDASLIVASHVNLGRFDAARAVAQRLLEIAPAFTIGAFARMGFVRQALMEAFVQALRKAGLPDWISCAPDASNNGGWGDTSAQSPLLARFRSLMGQGAAARFWALSTLLGACVLYVLIGTW